jgi:G2/mitotic-specific cyclin 1/2
MDDVSAMGQKPLQSKKTSLNTNANIQPLQRKRAALGDVSNVTKGDIIESKKILGSGKVGLVSKAAQPTGITKNLTRTGSSRSVLGVKDANKATTKIEVKRTGSGAGALGTTLKKQQTASSVRTTPSVNEETPVEDAQPALKKLHTDEADKPMKLEEEGKENQVVPPSVEETCVEQQMDEAVLDLDAEDFDDPLMAAEYVHEIFNYLKELEIATLPNANYMEDQKDLEWKMRGILVDWLIEVHNRFHLLPETLFLAVNIIDRFLSRKVVRLDRLQLIGATGMFIAAKYEEVLSPHVASFRHVADDGFTEAEILSAERWVLAVLDYDLSYPNPMNFLRRISKADNYDIHTRTIGKYLMEISLLDHRFMNYLPSHVAAAAMYLARAILERGEWVCTDFRSNL